MVFWETMTDEADEPAVFRDHADIWRAADKIVYSRALQEVSSAKTRIEREFDRDAIQRLEQSSGTDIAIGGAELAGRAIGEGLVDECHLFLCPIAVGGGKRALPDNVSVPTVTTVRPGRRVRRGSCACWSRARRGGAR